MIMPSINYQAQGHLIQACHIEDDTFLVLVQWAKGSHPLRNEFGQEFVVSFYLDGSREWMSGGYFDNLRDALDNYEERIR
jgi:hypothetical protein